MNDPANINGLPVAGNFDGNAANGDEVGLFDGTTLVSRHQPRLQGRHGRSPARFAGYPIVGDFDGDGLVDLATYQVNPVNKFFFDLGANGYGQVDATIDAASQFGFIGVRTRPVAADMDQDGTTDVGLWVPDRSGATADQYRRMVLPDVQFRDADRRHGQHAEPSVLADPVGHDIFARFGNQFAMPIVGNFDPPATPANANSGPTISGVVTAVSGANPVITWTVDDSDGIASTTFTVDGKKVPVYGPYGTKTHANYSASLAGLNLAPGSHSFVIQATDSARTPASTQYTGTFMIGGTTNSGPTIGNVVTAVSGAKPVITWNLDDSEGIASTAVTSMARCRFTVRMAQDPRQLRRGAGRIELAPGDHTFVIQATDSAATPATSQYTGTFTIVAAANSNSGPTIRNVVASTAKSVITWNASDPDGVASIRLMIDGAAVSGVGGPQQGCLRCANYSWSFGSLTVGTHKYVIRATDRTGKVSTSSGSFTARALSLAARNAVFAGASLSAASNWPRWIGCTISAGSWTAQSRRRRTRRLGP